MNFSRLLSLVALCASVPCFAATPRISGIGTAMEEMMAKNEIAGAVTVVVSKDKVHHLESTGFADIASHRRMTPDTPFSSASMTKPITGTAILMRQDEGQ